MSVSKTAFVDKTTGQKRAYALDALRGIAILMMVLLSVEPTSVLNHLPSFMYHGQVPPPNFKFDPNLPGVTWADMVFPFFLFSMGAAIPFALGRRMEAKTAWNKLVGAALLRGLLLSLFAFYIEHIRTGCVEPEWTAGMTGSPLKLFLIGTGGFLILFPALGRLPAQWKPSTRMMVKAAGWLAAIALMFIVRYDPKISMAHTSAFSLTRFDIIIMILANVAVYTTLIYIMTRKNLLLRLGIMGFIMALHFSNGVPGWSNTLYANFPIPGLQHLSFLGTTVMSILSTINSFFSLALLDYVFLTISGSIIGDRIVTWMNAPETKESQKLTWSKGRYAGLAVLFIGVVILSLILLKGRYVGTLVLVLIPILGLGYNMVRKPVCSIESLIHDVYRWGVYLLALGLMFEPYQGGIKKDPATLSYYFVPGGLAIFTLLFFTIIIEIFKKKRILQLLVDNGQNPMIAYAAGGNLVGTTLAFIGISELVKKNVTSPWLYFCYSLAFTLLVALAVSFCTRKKIFWRT